MKGHNRKLWEQNNKEIKTSNWKGLTDAELPDYIRASKNAQSSNTLINASYNSNSIRNLNEEHNRKLWEQNNKELISNLTASFHYILLECLKITKNANRGIPSL